MSRASQIGRELGFPVSVRFMTAGSCDGEVHIVEQAAHRKLARSRLNIGREWFDVSIRDAATAIVQAILDRQTGDVMIGRFITDVQISGKAIRSVKSTLSSKCHASRPPKYGKALVFSGGTSVNVTPLSRGGVL